MQWGGKEAKWLFWQKQVLYWKFLVVSQTSAFPFLSFQVVLQKNWSYAEHVFLPLPISFFSTSGSFCAQGNIAFFHTMLLWPKVHSLTEGSLVHVHSLHSHKNVPPDPATNWNNCFTMNQQIGGCHARACLSLSPCYSSLVVVHMGETLVMIKTGLIYHHGHRYDIYIFIQYLDLHYIYVAIYINYISCMYL